MAKEMLTVASCKEHSSGVMAFWPIECFLDNSEKQVGCIQQILHHTIDIFYYGKPDKRSILWSGT